MDSYWDEWYEPQVFYGSVTTLPVKEEYDPVDALRRTVEEVTRKELPKQVVRKIGFY